MSRVHVLRKGSHVPSLAISVTTLLDVERGRHVLLVDSHNGLVEVEFLEAVVKD